jgi:outer membrane receptor for ferrienterochelin and colicins
MNTPKLRGSLLVAITLTVPLVARAQSPDRSSDIDLGKVRDIADVSLADLLDSPIEVASKREQRSSEAPADTSVITGDEIELFGYRTLAEILSTLRDFHITNDRTYEYVGVRGIALPGDYNTRILLLVDGHRANENVYDSMAVGLDAPIDVSAIERVEVIRGPASSLYGSNAFLAVVNVVTKSGNIEKVRAQAETGIQASPAQYDSTRGWLLGGHRLQSGLDVLLSLSASHRFGTRSLYFGDFDDPATNHGVSVDKDRENAQNAFLKLGYRNFRLSGGYARRAKDEPAASFSTIFNDPRARNEDLRAFADLGYRNRLEGPRLALSGHATFDYYRYRGYFPEDTTAPGGPPSSLVNEDHVESMAWGTEAQATKTWIERAGLLSQVNTTAGVEYQNRARIRQWNGYPETGEVLLDRNDHSQFVAVFGMQEATLADKVTLGAGVRYDHWIAYHHALSPRLTLNLTPTATTRIKLMYGSAFRAANAYERFYGTDLANGGFTANPNLRPESIDSYELVIVQSLSSHLHVLGSAYSFHMRDMIALYTDASSGMLSFQNLAEVKAHGAGLEVEGAWPFVRFRASYVIQRATWTEAGVASTSLANSPHHMVKGRLVVPLLRERLQVFAEGWFLSQRDSVQSLAGTAEPVPAYLQLNLGGTLKLMPALALQLVARNVTNDKHRDPASDEFHQPDLQQQGLSVWLRLRYDFSLHGAP